MDFVEKFKERIHKINPDAFEEFVNVLKILKWKDDFDFNKSFKSGNPDLPHYWWSHKYTKAKSGETFETEKEMELSALIYYCNVRAHNKRDKL